MYKVTFAHKDNLSQEYPLYTPGSADYCLVSGKATLEEGKTGEMELSVPYNNPNRNEIVCLTDDVILRRSNKSGGWDEIFRGRVVTTQQDFQLTGRLSIEGDMAYLYDTLYPPFSFKGSPRSLLQQIVNNHNSFVPAHKQFTIGTITVKDGNNTIARESSSYEKTLDVLTSRFIDDAIGGFFRTRYSGGKRYLDYLAEFTSTATQQIKFGSNIIELAEEIEYGDLITALLPLGKMPEAEKVKTTTIDSTGKKRTTTKSVEQDDSDRLNISSVNSGDIYLRDSNLINRYGFIAETVTWDDVEQASNLKTRGLEYLQEHGVTIQRFTINVLDLAHVFPDQYDHFRLGDKVPLKSTPHGVDQTVELTKMNLNILAPEQDTFEYDDEKLRKARGFTNMSKTIIQNTVQSMVSTSEKKLATSVSNNVTNSIPDYIDDGIYNGDFDGVVGGAVYNNISSFDNVVANTVSANLGQFGTVVANTVQANLGEFNTVVANEVHAHLGEFDEVVADTVTAHLGTFDDVVANTVTAQLGQFDDVVATTVTAELGTFEQVVADTIEANLGTFGTVVADTVEANLGYFNDVVADTVTADIANFNSVITTALDTRYAAIDFANIDVATMGSFFSRSGIIQDVVTENGYVTGELVGVTISGDLIEGNTIKAEKLVIRGTDGLYYQLNTNGETVESQQTDYNSINGSNIQAHTITASKISVTDLYAFGARIANFILDANAIHTNGKDSVDDPTTGIYMDNMGQFNTGDDRNYIVSWHDTVNDRWKIAIRADEILTGGGQSLIEVVTNAEQAVDDMQQRMDSGEFAGHTPVITTTRSGNTTIMYVDGTEVARVADGANGSTPNVTAEKQGDVTYIRVDGNTVATINDGPGVNSVTVTYGTSASNETQPTTWSSTIPAVGEGEYLWTRTVTDYTGGVPDSVEYTYSKQGESGTPGTSVSVISIQYQAGTSATTAPTGTWSPSPVTVAEGQYLWTKTQFSDGNIAYSIAHQGKSGTNATAYWLIVSHAAVVKDESGNINPAAISLTAKSQTGTSATANYSGRFKIETTTDNSTWTTAYTSSANESAKTYTIPSTAKAVRSSLYSAGGTTTLLDQQTTVVVSDGVDGQDGAPGAAGKDAYTVILTNEAHTFPADNTKAIPGNLDVRVLAYKGTVQQNVSIGNITGSVTGMQITKKNQNTTNAAFNVAVTNQLTTQNGVLTIPVEVGGLTFTKEFSWALAKKGEDGVGITSVSISYGISASSSTKPTSWQDAIPTVVPEGQYLWTKTVTDYTDQSLTDIETYTYSRQGVDGEEGEAGTSVGIRSIQYQTGTSATTAPTGTWSNSIVSVPQGQFLWTKTTYTDNSEAYSVARQGQDGSASTTYSLIVSNAAVVKGANGVYSPTSITLTAKSQTGTGALSNYSGRFKIETTTDNSAWTAAYTSSSNEASKSYTIPANIKAIRCSLYLAGGTTTLLDQQTVVVVSDGIKGDPGTNGNGIAASFVRDNWTDAQWTDTYGIGKTLNLTPANYDSSGSASTRSSVTAKVGDYIVITGTSTNGKASYVSYFRVTSAVTNSTADIPTTCVSQSKANSGANGIDGKDAYTVILSNESHTFQGGTSAAVAGSTETNIIAFKGATQVAATIGTISGAPSGMTITPSGSGTTSAKLTISVTTAMTTKNGVVTIPITVDGKSFSKKFTYSLALTGAQGAQGPQGATAQWYYGTSLTHTSGTATLAASSTSGAVVGSMYLNTNTSNVYKCTAVGTNNTWTYAGNLTDGINVGGRNLFGKYSDCGTRLDGMSQSSENLFSIVTEDGYKCAKAVGAIGKTARLTSTLCIIPKPNEWITISCWVKISNISFGSTNPMCELYLDGQYFDASVAGTSDRVWRSVKSWKTYIDGVYRGTDQRVNTYITDTKWHHYAGVAQYYDLPYNVSMLGAFYLRDTTGTVWVRNIKAERGQIATDWTPAPEDVTADISTAQSTANAAQSTANTANSTANAAKASIESHVANYIEFKADAVTFSQLRSSTDKTINTKSSDGNTLTITGSTMTGKASSGNIGYVIRPYGMDVFSYTSANRKVGEFRSYNHTITGATWNTSTSSWQSYSSTSDYACVWAGETNNSGQMLGTGFGRYYTGTLDGRSVTNAQVMDYAIDKNRRHYMWGRGFQFHVARANTSYGGISIFYADDEYSMLTHEATVLVRANAYQYTEAGTYGAFQSYDAKKGFSHDSRSSPVDNAPVQMFNKTGTDTRVILRNGYIDFKVGSNTWTAPGIFQTSSSDCTISSGWQAYGGDNYNKPVVRKYGNVVHLRGAVSPTSNKTLDTTIQYAATIPSGYRPVKSITGRICQGSGTCIFNLTVETDGRIGISRYRNMGSTSYPSITSSTWLPFDVTYVI